ncbi:Cerato-platanin [Irpex rosettiformis]|uniref:Cerato-platanin n=1 Tax=Irpex rosettiformis TaxID=378272 RepID=A0ACB8UHC7_9APHY|nr:Cerato-platanin [Irpex rosettiformis]
MKFTFTSILSILSFTAAAAPALAFRPTVKYDNTYDHYSRSLSTVACSDGPNGLLTRGYSNFGSLPHFPLIGGAPAVSSWNSAGCGTCWSLTYNGKTIYVLAIDTGRDGFNLSEEAMNMLTNGQAEHLGKVTADASQVGTEKCGFSH